MSGNGGTDGDASADGDATADARSPERHDGGEDGDDAEHRGGNEHRDADGHDDVSEPRDGAVPHAASEPRDTAGRRDGRDRSASGDPSEQVHDSLLAALDVTGHLRVGLAVGVGLAAFLYLPRLPAFDRSIAGAEGFYLGLAFVLAATTAGLVTAALSIKTFLEPVLDRPAWLRRGGMAAVLGGLGWASTPLLAAGADAGAIGAGPWRTTTSLATLAVLVGAIGLHSAVKPGAAEIGGPIRRIERVAYWLVLVGLLIAAANATGDAAPTTIVEGGSSAGSGSGADGDAVATPFLLGALLASVTAIPFAATAELTGRLPRWRIRSLQIGALLGTLGTAWLVALDGRDWLVGLDAPTAALGLAVALAPTGLGWAIAGYGLWVSAARTGAPPPPDGSASELGDE